MWQLEVRGYPGQIGRVLKQEFHKQHVEEVDGGLDGIPTRRFPEGKPLGMRTQTKEGVSEQFRRILKSVQLMAVYMTEDEVKVVCGGEPGKSIYLKIETTDA